MVCDGVGNESVSLSIAVLREDAQNQGSLLQVTLWTWAEIIQEIFSAVCILTFTTISYLGVLPLFLTYHYFLLKSL